MKKPLVAAALALSAILAVPNIGFADMTSSENTPSIISQKNSMTSHFSMQGVITFIEKLTDAEENEYLKITLDDGKIGGHFFVKEDTFILNQDNSAFIESKELEAGQYVTVIAKKRIPSSGASATGVLLYTQNSNSDLSIYDDDLVNEKSTLALNIREDTHITDQKGSRKFFTPEDLQGKECLVLYSTSVGNEPAKTTPYFVMILQENIDTEQNQTISPPKKTESRSAIIMKKRFNRS